LGWRGEWDPSQSYLASSYAAAGGALRETAINSVLDEDRYLSSSRYCRWSMVSVQHLTWMCFC